MHRIFGIVAALVVGGCGSLGTPDDLDMAARGTVQFAVIGDLTGGERPEVFERAIDDLNALQPDFVLSVGDYIEGYTEDESALRGQWEAVEQEVARLDMPFFYLPGNHDISNGVMADMWAERRGATYWSRREGDILIIALDTEDPPFEFPPEMLARTRQIEDAMRKDPDGIQARILAAVKDRPAAAELPGQIRISADQVAFVEEALESHEDVHWTFVLMHKPAWREAGGAFSQIEKLLSERPYTVIAGHEHYYQHETRANRDYIVMGTTGGIWLKDGPGRVDHLLWVTMSGDEPRFVNIAIDGVFPKEGAALD